MPRDYNLPAKRRLSATLTTCTGRRIRQADAEQRYREIAALVASRVASRDSNHCFSPVPSYRFLVHYKCAPLYKMMR
jgi:hypothetical protein